MVKRTFTTLFCILTLPTVALASVFNMPRNGNDVVGQYFTVEAHSGDTLVSIGTDYDIGLHEMLEANPNVNPKRLRTGEKIIIPSAYVLPKFRKGIVINLAELRLYFFDHSGKHVYTYPVGLGRREWRTPTGSAKVNRKQKDPTWYVPESIADFVFEQTGRILPDFIPPGPENPLGPYAIYITLPGYLIHGTNQPWSIGKLISSGCIRLHNDDVAELYDMIQVGDPVHIIHHPYKVGWKDGDLFLEAHVPVTIDDPINKLNVLSVDRAIRETVKDQNVRIDWHRIDGIVRSPNGIPVPVGTAGNMHT